MHRTGAYLVICALLVLPSTTYAQIPVRLSAGVGVSSMNLNTEDVAGAARFSGFGLGGEATLGYGRLGLELRYLEGSLSPSDTGRNREMVEGELMLSVRALSWLRLKLGPHVRSMILPAGTERWLFWEGRLQTKTRLGTPRLTSRFEFWQVLSANIDVAEAFDGGQGIEGALRWEVSTLPVWIGLGYRIDRSNLGSGVRTEVMEHVSLTIGLGRGVEY